MSSPLLSGISLNKEQYRAVTFKEDVPLQILAGPGSGKTKVLTSRVAWLVEERRIPPSQICCVTFTNKAANEMRERLKKLIGDQRTNELVMGTFHALCARFLRKHGSSISLKSNFTICDAEESKRMISKILKSHADELAAMSASLDASAVLATISKAKTKGLDPQHMRENSRHPVDDIVSRVYADYAAALAESNSLDFDDLLVAGVKLFRTERLTVSWCRHVLVDEFQDTNTLQYELMIYMASAHRCVTIVGDPDQSIYGWRSAEAGNLGRMQTDFQSAQQILLEENYRSTSSILAASLAIVAEGLLSIRAGLFKARPFPALNTSIAADKSRIAKSLRTSHPAGTHPTLCSFSGDQAEAEFIATEIKRLVACHGGILRWSDFAILLRFNALSRVIESALQREGIPNRVLAGQKFFERLEIKDILAYLQVIDNPSYIPAFNRAANTPPRGLGEKSLSSLLMRSRTLGISPMELSEKIVSRKTSDIIPTVRRKLEGFLRPILTLRKMARKGAPVSDLIRRLLAEIKYEDHLKRSQQDWETRWENVQELINFASQSETNQTGLVAYDAGHPTTSVAEGLSHLRGELAEEVIDLTCEREQVNDLTCQREHKHFGYLELDETPLRLFLQATMLSSGTEAEEERRDDEEVIISTCHSAKGLEWPVVFVPAVEKGTFPFYRAEDKEEERRLLYVACTRAQGFLYLSNSTRRMIGGEWTDRDISEFVSIVVKKHKGMFSHSPPAISVKGCSEIARLLGRDPVHDDIINRKIQEYNQMMRRNLQQTREALITINHQLPGPSPPVHKSFTLTSNAYWSKPSIPAPKATTAPSGRVSRSGGLQANADIMMSVPQSAHTPLATTPVLAQSPPGLKTERLVTTNDPGALNVGVPCTPNNTTLQATIKLAAGKRRLGMGRLDGAGYPNKKSSLKET